MGDVVNMSAFVDAGLFDPDATDAEDVRGLILMLVDAGWSTEEIIARSECADLRELAFSADNPPEYSPRQAADMLGMSIDEFDALRRTAGLAPRAFDQPSFSKDEVGAFIGIQQGGEMFTLDEANHFARVLGSSIARIADAAFSLFLIDVEGPAIEAGGTAVDVVRLNQGALASFDAVAASLDPLLRLHMEDAVNRSRSSRGDGDDPSISRMAVGFVDLVGFTAFSEMTSTAELGRLVRQFEDMAYDIVTEHGGRVVKLIGDEVMYVAVEPQVACDIATSLIAEFRAQHVTPRGGLAYGELLARGGDYYGPIVNLASRVADLAVPCELLATPELADRCPQVPFEPAGRRQLKGFADPVRLLSLNC